ncbi:DeoR/GlpR family DNA-binding transcription regulator [Novosphingobium sp. 9]|uniref:DeoR/GlpR family DNA-binding transcription regulator n=1 Tax=Novosphingobium sp. 9 TaxID=2025349 RepID=UPI0021B6C0AD|nr:DeoR/GlpR family DNA-binding transcription regulator [Novosphingobium sp. 9]
MIQADRFAAILSALEAQGACGIGDLAQAFGVSEETIRRDVRQLESTGRVLKVHGGVTLPERQLEAPYRTRLRERADAKRAIARVAGDFVENGMTVLVDSGTTSFWVAREFLHRKALTVVTNNLEVAHEGLGLGDHRIFFAGGRLDVDYRAGFDADAIAYTRRFVPDVAILSMGAVDAARGFLDFDPGEASYKRAVLDIARRVVVVADAGKFGLKGTMHVAPFTDVHDLVTDQPPSPDVIEAARAAGMRVHVAA